MARWLHNLVTPEIVDRPAPPTGVHPVVQVVGSAVVADILGGSALERAMFVATPFLVGLSAQVGAYRGAAEHTAGDPGDPGDTGDPGDVDDAD